MYLARKHTDMSFPEIGRFMGNKNHSTVILANRRISKAIQANETASWVTPEGMREQNLAALVAELEEQFLAQTSSTECVLLVFTVGYSSAKIMAQVSARLQGSGESPDQWVLMDPYQPIADRCRGL